MFRTMKYHYKCNDIEHRILMFLFHIITISKKEQVNKIVVGYNKGLKQNGINNETLSKKQK